MVKQQVFGAAGQLDDPIIDLAAGYHTFFPTTNSRSITGFIETGATKAAATMTQMPEENFEKGSPREGVPLYRMGTDFKYGELRGNYIMYKYYSKANLGDLGKGLGARHFNNIRGNVEGSGILNRALQYLGSSLEAETLDNQPRIDFQKVPASEEQTFSVGGKRQEKTAYGAPGPVDIETNKQGFKYIQVTTERLSKLNQHGIYGKKGLGKDLQNKINEIRKKYRAKGGMNTKAYKEVAKEGLIYFKKRVPMWNLAMKKMQVGTKSAPFKNFQNLGDPTALRDSLRGAINRSGGISIRGMEGFNKLQNSVGSSGFFNSGAFTITGQALANFDKYLEGVHYSYRMDPAVHALIGTFQLERNPLIQFKLGSLNQAHVVYGLDATTHMFTNRLTKADAYFVNSTRSHAQTFAETKVTSGTGTVGSVLTTGAAGLNTASGKVLPSINVFAANKELSEYVKKEFIPEMQTLASKNARTFPASSILGPKKPRTMRGIKMWALPYLSVFDAFKRRQL